MSNQDEPLFVNGLIVKRNDSAPEWAICKLSIRVDELTSFLKTHERSGWVNCEIKRSKAGKYFAVVDQWKPTDGDAAKTGVAQARQAAIEPSYTPPSTGDFDDDIPFSNYEYKGWA